MKTADVNSDGLASVSPAYILGPIGIHCGPGIDWREAFDLTVLQDQTPFTDMHLRRAAVVSPAVD